LLFHCQPVTDGLPETPRLQLAVLRLFRGEAIMKRRAVASLVISFITATSMLLAAGAPD
jgi:hypothetical protein